MFRIYRIITRNVGKALVKVSAYNYIISLAGFLAQDIHKHPGLGSLSLTVIISFKMKIDEHYLFSALNRDPRYKKTSLKIKCPYRP